MVLNLTYTENHLKILGTWYMNATDDEQIRGKTKIQPPEQHQCTLAWIL